MARQSSPAPFASALTAVAATAATSALAPPFATATSKLAAPTPSCRAQEAAPVPQRHPMPPLVLDAAGGAMERQVHVVEELLRLRSLPGLLRRR